MNQRLCVAPRMPSETARSVPWLFDSYKPITTMSHNAEGESPFSWLFLSYFSNYLCHLLKRFTKSLLIYSARSM
jgi:hypothetical protein